MNYTVYTEAEKNIFTNAFIDKKDNSKQEFEEYVKSFLKSLPLENKPVLNTPKPSKKEYTVRGINKPSRIFVPEGTQFNTHNTLWDLKTKDNLVTHFLAHPDFGITNTSLHKLNFLHPDWNHQNKDGKNALMLLAQRYKIYDLMKVLTDFKLDPNKQDKDHKFFTHYFFATPETQKELISLKTNAQYNINAIKILMDTYPHHFEISPVRLQRIANQWSNTLEKLTVASTSSLINLNLEYIEEQSERILSKFLSMKLEKIFDEKKENYKKIKI